MSGGGIRQRDRGRVIGAQRLSPVTFGRRGGIVRRESVRFALVGAATTAVTFFGVRGSTPCAGPDTVGFGGNTSCVVIDTVGETPIVLDLGTGLRAYGATLDDGPWQAVSLLTHLHWDHVQGLPFFRPVLRSGSRLDIYAPPAVGGLAEAFDRFMCDPYFPVGLADLDGEIAFHEFDDGVRTIAGATVTACSVPHRGRTNGYRIDRGGISIAYIPDHQQPEDGSLQTTDAVRELCAGVDLLIHDAQYTPTQFTQKKDWGHCTIEYACWLAAEVGARRLALFHHDPSHDDRTLECLMSAARNWGTSRGIDVFGAREALTVRLGQ
jgi:phosphoribosyl 1,2-cyclic phosphodiesterase